jgi:hypothetical protein
MNYMPGLALNCNSPDLSFLCMITGVGTSAQSFFTYLLTSLVHSSYEYLTKH